MILTPEEERHFKREAAQDGAHDMVFGTFTGAVYENTYVEVYCPAKNATFRCLPILPVGYSAQLTKEWADEIKESHIFAVSFAYGSLKVPVIVGVIPRPQGAIMGKTGGGSVSSVHAKKSHMLQEHETGNIRISNKSSDEEDPMEVAVESGKVKLGKPSSQKQPIALAEETISIFKEFLETMSSSQHIDPQSGQPGVIPSPKLISDLALIKSKLDSIKSQESETA